MEYFKKCPECGRYMVSEIVSTGHVKWVCTCGNVMHTGYTEIICDNKTTTGGNASDRTVIK